MQIEEDAGRLRAGAKAAWGPFLQGLTDWDAIATLTFRGSQPGPGAEARWTRVWACFYRWIGDSAGLLGRAVDFFAVLELHRSGLPHLHALLETGGADPAVVSRLQGAWTARHGFARVQRIRSLDACARYATKHLADGVSYSDLVMSARLCQRVAERARSHGRPCVLTDESMPAAGETRPMPHSGRIKSIRSCCQSDHSLTN